MSLIDMQPHRPRLLVIAGPNGSGKSTVTKGLPIIGTYVNADEIKRQSDCSALEAAQEAELKSELESQQEKQEELENYENYIQSDEYKESVAQSKLGLVHENEIIFRENE